MLVALSVCGQKAFLVIMSMIKKTKKTRMSQVEIQGQQGSFVKNEKVT